MLKLNVKKAKFENHPVQFGEQIHVSQPFYGIKPQYQRAELIPGGDCETAGDFTAETAGSFSVGASGDARVGSESIDLTQITAASLASVYLLLSGPVDLSWAKFVGMWCKPGDTDEFDPGDLYFYIFTRQGNYLYANRARGIDFFRDKHTEPATGVWHYREIDLDRMTKASGFETDDLSEVWGIGWYSLAGTNGNVLNIDQIEFYTHGTGLDDWLQNATWAALNILPPGGPARGNIISVPLVDDVHACRGYAMAWDDASGRAKVAADNEDSFMGICVANPSSARLVASVAQNATSIIVEDASLFQPGKATIWDDSNSEAVTISAVNRVTDTITCSAIAQALGYTIGRHAKIAMEGNEVGSIRVDVLVDGVVNMYCEAAVEVDEGVSMSNPGASPMVDDGGAGSQGVMIGKALEAGAAKEAANILLRVMGDQGT